VLGAIRAVIAGVPRGKVTTYGRVAEAAGYPQAARLTVRALQQSDGLPWHRVVGAEGRIALLGVEGQEQRLRLEMEGVAFRGPRVRMDLHEWTPRVRVRRSSGPPRPTRGSRRRSKQTR
jgi:methylated-DNA-protein-cysteine methyltransferase related protein